MVRLSEADFFQALGRKLVNPRFLKLRFGALSDELIKTLLSKHEFTRAWIYILESLVAETSIDELMGLGESSLLAILHCSIMRMNIPIFTSVMQCIEGRAFGYEAISCMLRREEAMKVLMKADAVELLRRMIHSLPVHQKPCLIEALTVQAIKVRARSCLEYLKSFSTNWSCIPGILGAHAYAGDFERVKTLCSASNDSMYRGIMESVITGQVHIAAFLRAACYERHPDLSRSRSRDVLVSRMLKALELSAERPVIHRLLGDGSSTEFLSWLFEGIRDFRDKKADERESWFEYAIRLRLGQMCHYLADRGCDTFKYYRRDVRLEKKDLFDFIELCCGVRTGYGPYGDPAMELFLAQRGIPRTVDFDCNPVCEIIREGFCDASLSERVELVKHYLQQDPSYATRTVSYYLKFTTSLFEATPLGHMEVHGIPTTEIWSGKPAVENTVFVDGDEKKTDEWKLSRPNEKEIQALRDMRAALIEHGADPEFLFAPDTLMILNWRYAMIPAEFVRRLIQGRADVNHTCQRIGQNPLLAALHGGQSVKVIKVLLDAGGSVDFDEVENSPEMTAQNILWAALFASEVRRNRDMLRLILDRKADLNLYDSKEYHSTPLAWVLVADYQERLEVAELLLELRADVDARDHSGRSAIFRAIKRDSVEAVEWLINRGADLSITGRDGKSPIDFARSHLEEGRCSVEIVRKIEKAIHLESLSQAHPGDESLV